MVYEMLVGLHVTNNEMYRAYREKMTPVLVECGDGFGYDFAASSLPLAIAEGGRVPASPVAPPPALDPTTWFDPLIS